ncbi:MAG: hypothetical protein RIC19_01550 [Phaeodactylibacter sp.]|uniref:hypothetical protein n=1 Tax=Phaeodactylibacter sp. TaxID=1940289 RepID=UPI0032F02E30
MKRLIFLLPLLFSIMLVTDSASAQEYRTAVGARLGYPLSASLKYFLNDSGHALEAYVGTRGWGYGRWVNVSAAYQIHNPLEIEGLEGLYWYYGAGATVFFWNYDDAFVFDDDYSSTAIGVQGYLGLDYAFQDTPISLSIDWVPTFAFNGYSRGFGGGYGNIGVRYILAR